MRYLGLDLGTKTLGIALSDTTRTIATNVGTLHFKQDDYEAVMEPLRKIIEEENIGKIVLGLPKNMNNTIGERGETTISFQKKLEEYFQIPVVLQDERLSTVAAHRVMVEADMSRKKRKQKVDSVAANIILQTYLDKERGKMNE